jgi:hypothetical protein
MDNYHLAKDADQWKLRRQGADRAALVFDNKKDAVDGSAEFMRQHGGSLKIHKENHRIQEERTYPRSADPRRTPG